jgi:predicted DCC family thiol-disulfide oxidoreductase YuxK
LLRPFQRNAATTLRDTYLSADVRWLGIFRILYGCSLIVELLRRWPDLRLYYSDDGILPTAFARLYAPSRYSFSIFDFFGSVWAVELAFAGALFCFVAFTLGYRTRLFHALSLVCITSLDSRNVLLENAGITLVNLLGAWSLFLPLGRRFSVDALLASLRRRDERSSDELNDRSRPLAPTLPYRSVAVLGLILQWSAIYFFNFVHKTGPSWRDGSALHWFLEQNRIVTALGVWARGHLSESIWATLTYGALYGEAGLAVALLVPVWRRQARLVALATALALHGTIVALARLGPFSYLMILGFVPHLSAADLNVLSRWFGRTSRARTVLYDSDCGICLFICRVLKRLDPLRRLTFVGNDERERFPVPIDGALLERSLVVILPSGAFVSEGRAVFEVLRAVPLGVLFGWWLRVPGLAAFGNYLYRVVARNRTEISSGLGLAACGVPVRGEASGSLQPAVQRVARASRGRGVLHEALAATFLITLGTQALLDNQYARQRVHIRRPHFMAAVVESARLFEGWSMFAPEPPHEDGHLVVDAETLAGRRVDPFTGRAPALDPVSDTGWGNDQLWCDYSNNLRLPSGARYRPLLGAYLRHWQRVTGHPQDQLVRADVWWTRSKAPAPGDRRGTALAPQHLLAIGRAADGQAHLP